MGQQALGSSKGGAQILKRLIFRMAGFRIRFALAVVAAVGSIVPAHAADSITAAMSRAYENNSQLNAGRAALRATNEGVPLAKSGMRPRVTSSLSLASVSDSSNGVSGVSTATFGIEINQAIFDGFQTRNNVQAAEAQVRAERENLRNTEQNTLFDAAQVYMDVLQNRQIERLRAQNLEFLREQLRAARARFEVGEGTRTDVAQAEASLSAANAQLSAAKAATKSSEAVFQQIIGTAPANLATPRPLSKVLPRSLGAAEQTALANHPAIGVRDSLIDAGIFSVKAAEGAFLPQLSVSAGLSKTYVGGGRQSSDSERAEIGARLTVPIYQGGQASATVRQRKEQVGQARLEKDVARDQVRAAVTSSWTQLEASRAQVAASNETVRASRLALDGVVEERNVGQRTTLDVLNAQATLINGQISLVQAQRNLVVSSYALASAAGKLSAKRLGLHVKIHEPEVHYNKVKDAWFGLRTVDGR